MVKSEALKNQMKSINNFIVKYKKPKILLIDTDEEVVNEISSAGFNVSVGTFGVRYNVKISSELIPIYQQYDLPNYPEKEIIIIDLKPPNKIKNPKQIMAVHGEKYVVVKSDLGIILDEDADRIVFLNEKGEKINPDLITNLLVKKFFKNKKKILYTVIASQAVKEEIENSNSVPICSKVGHTFIKEKMKKKKIDFGAESSGHYYLKDNYFNESPFIILLKVLEIISKENKPLSELVKPFKRYYLEKINFPYKDKIKKLLKKVEKKYKKIGKISRIDGLKIEFSDYWFNLRSSNTEPLLRLTIEANSKELLEQKKKELSKLISAYG